MRVEFEVDARVLKRLRRRTPELLRRAIQQTGIAVEAEAMELAPESAGPKGGNLKSQISSHLINNETVVVKCSAKYAEYVHEGTGLYGPRRQKIRPVRAKALKIPVPGGHIFRAWSRGMRPRPFLMAAVRKVVPGKMGSIFRRVTGEVLFK